MNNIRESETICHIDHRIRTHLAKLGKLDDRDREQWSSELRSLKERRFEKVRTKGYDRMLNALK